MSKQKQIPQKKHSWLRFFLRLALAMVFFLFIAIAAVLIAVQTPYVQTKISNYAIEQLNQEFNTKIKVDSVDLDFFGDFNLYNVTAKDSANQEFIRIKKIQLSANWWKLIQNQETIFIDNLTLYQPKVQVITKKGAEDSNFIKLIDSFDDGKESKDSKFKLEGGLEIINGDLLIVNENLAKNEQIWLDSKQFNAKIKDFKYFKKEINAQLQQMSFSAVKNGEEYELQDFSNQFFYSNKQIRFNDLNLKTKNSELIGSFAFEFDSIEQFSDFSNLVRWNLDLQPNSTIAFKDIRYWTTGWAGNKTASIQGKVSGTLNDLTINQLKFSGANNLLTAQSLNLMNVTDVDAIQIDGIKINAQTSYQKLRDFLPKEITKDVDVFVSKFGNLDYNGNLSYNQQQIAAKGNLKTKLGNAKIDAVVTNFNQLDQISYQGTLQTNGFDLQALTEKNELGSIAGNFKFNGKGATIKTLNIQSKSKLDYLDLFGKRYYNVDLDGKLSQQVFAGNASINDPNFKLNYNGIVDFSSQPIYLKFNSNINHLNLDHLGFTNNNSILQSVAKGEIYYTNINDFHGDLDIQDIKLSNNNTKLQLAHAIVSAQKHETGKRLAIEIPAYLIAEVSGEFVLQELPDAILNSFQDLIVDYQPATVSPNQLFDFSIQMQQDIISTFYPDINIQPNTSLQGTINTNTQDVVANLSTPGFNYAGLDFFGTVLDINTQEDQFPLTIESDSVQFSGINLKSVQILAQPQQDQLAIQAQFFSGKKSAVKYNLNLVQTIDPDKNMILRFAPSNITINETVWDLNPTDDFYSNQLRLNFEKNQYQADEIVLRNENQEISLKGYYNGVNDYDVSAKIKDLLLSKFIPKEVLGDLNLTGIANGNINVIKSENGIEPTAKLDVFDINLNQYSIGDLSLSAEYFIEEEKFDLTAELNQENIQAIFLTGTINNKPNIPELDLEADIDQLNLNFLQVFLSGALSNIRGKTSGNLLFTGPANAPSYNGTLNTHDFGFTVDYLNTDYVFNGENSLLVSKEGNAQGVIYLSEIPFQDSQFNTKGTVSGGLLFTELTNWYFNLSFNTNNLLVLNTTERNNDLYHGRLFANGTFHLDGTPNNLLMEAQAKVNPNSELTINTGSYFVDTNNDLVRFVPKQIVETEQEYTEPAAIELDLEIEVDELSVVKLVFDAATNDRLVSRGTSNNLNISMNRKGDLTMNGLYQITNGVYEFRQFPALQRDFNIIPGGQIAWSGSPYNAELNITASYPRLVSNVGEYLGVGYSQVYEVELNINMTDVLSKPGFDFDIKIPKSGTDIQSQLALRMNSSPDEELKQFGFVLLTGQFGVNSTNALQNGVNTAATGLAFRQISNVLSSIAKEIRIDVDYVQGNELSSTSDRIGARVSLDVHPRIVIRGTGGVPLDNAYNENLTLEVEADYDISKDRDKSLVLKAFSRPTTFGVENFNATTATQQYGVGISHTKSFNKLSDLFKSKKRIQQEQEELEKLKIKLRRELDSISADSASLGKQLQSNTQDTIKQHNITKSKQQKTSGLVRFQ